MGQTGPVAHELLLGRRDREPILRVFATRPRPNVRNLRLTFGISRMRGCRRLIGAYGAQTGSEPLARKVSCGLAAEESTATI